MPKQPNQLEGGIGSQAGNLSPACELASERLDRPEGAVHRIISLRFFLISFIASAMFVLLLAWFFLDGEVKRHVLSWSESSTANPLTYGVIIAGVLATDLILPIPSSAVMTHAGMRLGVWAGTIAGFVGITLGSLLGFAAARWWGQRYINKRVKSLDQDLLVRMANQWGVFVVVLLRPVPILAEASVLLLAVGQMGWIAFLSWLSVSNLFIAFFFSALGSWVTEKQIAEMPVLILATLGPCLLLIIVRLVTSRFFQKDS